MCISREQKEKVSPRALHNAVIHIREDRAAHAVRRLRSRGQYRTCTEHGLLLWDWGSCDARVSTYLHSMAGVHAVDYTSFVFERLVLSSEVADRIIISQRVPYVLSPSSKTFL